MKFKHIHTQRDINIEKNIQIFCKFFLFNSTQGIFDVFLIPKLFFQEVQTKMVYNLFQQI